MVTLPDNHPQYALTQYGLVGVLLIAFVTWAFCLRGGAGRKRGRAAAAGHFAFL